MFMKLSRFLARGNKKCAAIFSKPIQLKPLEMLKKKTFNILVNKFCIILNIYFTAISSP